MVDTSTNCGKAAFGASLAAIVIGVLVLVGWFFQVDALKSVLQGTVTMNPATALAMILAGASLGISLLAQHQNKQDSRVLFISMARACALVVAWIGLMRLAAIISGWDIGVDQWMFPSQVSSQVPFPSRIAPNVALNLLLLGIALLLVDVKKRSVCLCVELFVLFVGLGSLVAVLGYAYDVQSFYRLGTFIPMALNTAITFLVLSAALFLSHTDSGLLAIFAGDGAGGNSARQIMPAVVLLPGIFGWLELHGERAGVFGSEWGNAIFAVSNILVFTLLICWSAKALFRTDLERKKTEESMRASEEKFRQLAESITDVFWITSPDLKTKLYISPGYQRIWGRSPESLYADPQLWSEAIIPEARGRVSAAFAGLAGNETEASAEYQITRPDGAVRWIHDRGFQVRDAAGTVIRITGIASDITERKQAEEAMQRRQSELRVLFDLMPAMIWFKDRKNGILRVNRRVAEAAGKSIEEIEGKPSFEKDYADDLEVIRSRLPRLGIVEMVRNQNGKHEWFQKDRVPYFDTEGEVIGIVVMAQNITERKRLETQLFQSQNMETVGKLAGGIAHEFNSILTAIIGQSELLLNSLPSGSPLTQNATEIGKAADRAATLTRQLLAYGSKQLLQPETLDLNSVLAGLESNVRHLIGADTDVHIVSASGLRAVKADVGQIEQVIMNMVINAHDAMPHGGKLTLATSNVTLDQEVVSFNPEMKPGNYVLLAITDTGAGMSAEVRTRAFEPFFTTKDVGEGAGLGLSTCYGIIKQSGGKITVYSEPGQGTCFKIYLPQVKQRPELPIQRLDSAELPRGTETILLVGDDPALREMAATLLGRLGYKVLMAANGVEALGLVQQRDMGPIDLLFTEAVMPQMCGKELARRMRKLNPSVRILFTAATEKDVASECGFDKGAAFLQEPFTPPGLAHKLREILDQPQAQVG